MKIPHQEPIRFVKEIIKKEEKKVTVTCSFPYEPSLAMVCEAAAQASAGFANEDDIKIGYLISLKDVEQKKEFKHKDYNIDLEHIFNFGSMNTYDFNLTVENEIYATGNFVVALEDKDNS